ncbi:glycosyltransferase [Cylindrospermum sp. FACHB-282]|uniref:glycosyltransferase n=1 Tax=Cylindrospermum sp. FACHB-282 TaxID=2692794 RepID=UPI001687B6EF|nr:glycosyltransferase [Cylindrospermum sp. FACHB-282]MBD2388331.1 glycosyltransferase [Cylindrospermum sp. FACHB-282]
MANSTQQRPYRVALVHPSAGINWSGGSEIFAIELARHLSPDFEVELLAGASCSPFYYPAGGIGRIQARQILRHLPITPLLQRFSTHPDIVIEHLTSFLPCALHLLRHPADVIFPCNDYGGLAMAAFVRTLIGTPIVYTEHTGLLAQGRSLTRNLRFRPDHLVVFSQAIANFAQTLRPSQPITIIPNGVDTNRFTPQGEQISLGLNKPLVLCVATLNRRSHKRVELAIQAVASLPSVSLLICGDGCDQQYFQNLGEELLGCDRFAIKTFPAAQMPQVYRSADVFTLPSINEPFGIAYLEAMATGLPIVATDDEMRRYMIGDNGILCDVTNIDKYAAAIAKLLKVNWQQKIRQNALHFSWNTLAKTYRNLISQTILHTQKS